MATVIRIKRGLKAAIPSSVGQAGELVVATDTKELYYTATNGGNPTPVKIDITNVLNAPPSAITAIRRTWFSI